MGLRMWLRDVVLQRHLGAMRRVAAEAPENEPIHESWP